MVISICGSGMLIELYYSTLVASQQLLFVQAFERYFEHRADEHGQQDNGQCKSGRGKERQSSI